MLTNIFGTTSGSPSTSAANFVPVMSVGATPTATETARLQVVPAAFTMLNFYVSINNAPGTGKSYTFTVRKNQVDTAITITISDSAVSGFYNGAGVSFAAGDTIDIGITPSGTPTAPTLTYWNFQADSGGTHFSLLLGGAMATTGLSTSAESFNQLTGATAAATWGATEATQEIVCPCGGTIDQLYVIADAAPGASKSFTIKLNKNGSDTALSAQVSGTNKTGNDTSNSVSVSAGDTLSISATPAGTPTVGRYCWGLKFTPTVAGQSFFGFGNSTAASTSATQYEQPLGLGAGTYSATETTRQVAPGIGQIQALYGLLGTAPGVGTSRILTLRRGAVSTTAAVTISNANTTGNITGLNVGLNQASLLSLQSSVSGSPAADTNGVHIGVLVFNPLAAYTKGNGFLTLT